MLVGGATCIGEAHKRNGIPLQDAFKVFGNSTQKYVVAIVSDGAGSAKHAEIGSNRICSIFTDEVRHLCEESQTVSFDKFKETTSFAIQSARRSLVDDGYSLADCHATIVATLAFDDRCFLVHLGDGLQVVLIREPSGAIAACVSEPENGDAANETFFYTEDDWHSHLRITEIPRDVLACFLMSDGMEEFVWNPKTGLKLPFCRPLLQNARQAVISGQDLNEILSEIVSDERTNQFTNDDKTLCLVLRDSAPVTIHEAGNNLNQYIIRNGHPVKFSPSADTPAPPRVQQRTSPQSVSNTLPQRPTAKPPTGVHSNSLGAPDSEESWATEGYKRGSRLVRFFLGLAIYFIGLGSGYFLNELERDPPWVVKDGSAKTSSSVAEKESEKAKLGSDITDHSQKQENGVAPSTSSPSKDVERTKGTSPTGTDKANVSTPSSAAKVVSDSKTPNPTNASNAPSKSTPSDATKESVSTPPSVSKGTKVDTPNPTKASNAPPKSAPTDAAEKISR